MAESSYMIAPGETSDGLSMRKKLALALAQKNLEPLKIEHWAQGLAHLGDQAYSGYEIGKINREEKDESAKGNALLAQMFTGQAPQAAASPDPSMRPASVSTPMGNALKDYRPADPTAPTVPVATDPGAPVNLPRPEVMPSAKVWGDKEAEAAGLYEPAGPKAPFQDRYAAVAPTGPVASDAIAPKPVQTQKIAQALQAPTAAAPQAPGGMNREQLIQMLGNRKTAPMARAIMQSTISKQFEPTKPTDEMREYDLYRQQGGKDKFVDYKTGLKKAGAIQNSVQIDQKGESEFSKESGKLQAKRFNELADDAPAAKQMLSDVEVLRDLGTKIETGKGAEVRAAIGPYAEALGIKVDGLSEIQAYEAVVNRVAPNLRVKGSGAQSDFELKNFMKSLPSIGNTPGGNEMSSRVLEGLYQNKMTAAEIGAKALNGEITRPQAEKMIRDLPDPMKEWREFKKQEKAATPDAGWKEISPGIRIREKK